MKILKKLFILVSILFILAGCSNAKRYTSYTIYPIGYLLNRIGGNRIEPVSIQDKSMVQIANLVPNYE
ncbi:MAG: hypothetical protein J6S49_04860 [Erysipelotrichaceae bacterium]|nr:hypothetical protein [Erysipelotrichaceae bacterium]